MLGLKLFIQQKRQWQGLNFAACLRKVNILKQKTHLFFIGSMRWQYSWV